MRAKSRFFLLPAMVVTMLLSGCGYQFKCGTTFGSSTCTPSGGGIGTGGGGGMGNVAALAYDINQTGTVDGIGLTVSASSATLAGLPSFSAPAIPFADPGVGMVVAQKKFVYAVFELTQQIFGWSIDPTTGGLTTLSGMPLLVPLTGTPISLYNHMYVTTNPAGTLLFISEAGNTDILIYQIDSAGALTPAAASPFPTGALAGGNMAVDSLGKFLYICEDTASHNGTSMAGYAIGAGGTLTPVPGSPFLTIPMWEVQSDATGKFLIGTTGNSTFVSGLDDNNLYVFSIDQTTGTIAAVTNSPFATVFSPFFIAAQPNSSSGSFVYSFSLTAGGYNAVEGYQLNTTTGALTALSGSPFSNLSTSLWGQFDQSGAYMFIYRNVNSAPELGVLNVDGSTGALSEPASTLALGASGYWVVTDPQ